MKVASLNSRWILVRAFDQAIKRRRARLAGTTDAEVKAIENAFKYVTGEFFLRAYAVETFQLARDWASRMLRDVEDGDNLALEVAWEVTAEMLATRHGLDDGEGLTETRRFWNLVCMHVYRVRPARIELDRK